MEIVLGNKKLTQFNSSKYELKVIINCVYSTESNKETSKEILVEIKNDFQKNEYASEISAEF